MSTPMSTRPQKVTGTLDLRVRGMGKVLPHPHYKHYSGHFASALRVYGPISDRILVHISFVVQRFLDDSGPVLAGLLAQESDGT